MSVHDNTPVNKAAIVTDFRKSEKFTVLPHPPYSPDLASCDYFSSQDLKIIYLGKDITREKRLDLPFISVLRVYMLKTMKNAFKIGSNGSNGAFLLNENILKEAKNGSLSYSVLMCRHHLHYLRNTPRTSILTIANCILAPTY